ncbi:HlyD family secretion protein [Dongia deserti]|uniref:HlyD family secretion protein n=1 Tax=Dongia deserti TaxID=2268030 RepID=UPI000E64BABE|nr:HlyD family efflux transporter periplasmic adaptor subunit [Dongia deserti]
MTALRVVTAFALLIVIGGCDRPDTDTWQGYVEAEYTYVAPLETGRIIALAVERGDQVQAGQPLFTLEDDAERAARNQAAAELAQAEADLADLRKGDRPEDLAIIQAQLDKARASLALSVPRLARREKMVKGSIIGEEELDEAKSAILADRGNIAEYEARLAEAKLPARIDKIAAAERLVEARKAALADAAWRLSRRQERAPAAARVEDVFFRAGETASAGQGIVSLLTPDKVKLRFFVPEPALATIAVGQKLAVSCDSCPPNLTATITFIARTAEFTPPVIYSLRRREKLVFLVEARPDDLNQPWHPGLPVDVRPLPAAPSGQPVAQGTGS